MVTVGVVVAAAVVVAAVVVAEKWKNTEGGKKKPHLAQRGVAFSLGEKECELFFEK